MNKKWLTYSITAILLVILLPSVFRDATAFTVFVEDFTTANFTQWSRTNLSPGTEQTISGGIARFIVPTPTGGAVTYSSIVKDGFTSTINSTIIASQDILITKVPNNCPQGSGAIFFLYICDSADLGGNQGNIGVGIDGSSVWSLWVGGSINYTYVFQTAGSAPLSNTWYHIVLTVNNSASRVTLNVDGTVVIDTLQRQFTNRDHAVSLMLGLGESWWSSGVGSQEVDIDNVQLDISDAAIGITPNPTPQPTFLNQAADINPTYTATPAPKKTPTPTTQSPTTEPTNNPTATTTPTSLSYQNGFSLWMLLPLVVIVAVCLQIALVWKRHNRSPTATRRE